MCGEALFQTERDRRKKTGGATNSAEVLLG